MDRRPGFRAFIVFAALSGLLGFAVGIAGSWMLGVAVGIVTLSIGLAIILWGPERNH